MKRKTLLKVVPLLGMAGIFIVGCDSSTPGVGLPDSAAVDTSAPRPDQALPRDSGPADAGADVVVDAFCAPTITGCVAGNCGTISDPCSGETFQCGACEAGKVCSVETHSCIEPLLTCEDLGAECGVIKNSCGTRLGCGSCGDGLECDPDSNSCVPCNSAVSCEDMGFECGQAWLGCGDPADEKNKVDCGSCPTGKVCNASFNVCEDSCTPPGDKAKFCADAKARGAECGVMSNGCGGLIDCGGCPTGKQCGIYGVANRCEALDRPDECRALGYECGSFNSVCGGKVDCGSCATGTVCNDNHLCGPPCEPKTCAAFAAKGKACGTFDDGCKGKAVCACPTKGDVCLDATNSCCTPAACEAGKCGTVKDPCGGKDLSCGCGKNEYCDTASGTCKGTTDCTALGKGGATDGASCSDFPLYDAGGGAKVACPCTGGFSCINDGTAAAPKEGSCCRDTTSCDAARCNYRVTNKCTGLVQDCGCSATQYCDSNDRCQPLKNCAALGKGLTAGGPCNDNPFYDPGNGTKMACQCIDGMICLGDSPSAEGNCCADTAVCQPMRCNQVQNTCTLDWRTCPCPANHFCDGSGDCKPYMTCDDYKADRQPGSPCTNNASTNFPRYPGDPVGNNCPCLSGDRCVDGSDVAVARGAVGTCLDLKACADYTTRRTGQPCSAGGNPAWPTGEKRANGSSIDLTCTCTGGNGDCVYTAPDPDELAAGSEQGVCTMPKVCTDYTTSRIGQPCGAFSVGYNNADGSPRNITCDCSTSGGYTNIACLNGSCACTPRNCNNNSGTLDCRLDGQSNNCGGTLTCKCPSGTCSAATGNCCENFTCSNLPAGYAAGACGTIQNSCAGTNFTCGCTGGKQCNNTSHTCCDVYSCAALPPGAAKGSTTGKIGEPCGSFANSCLGTNFSCSCDTGGGKTNNKCVAASCVCTKTPQSQACAGQTGLVADGCGGQWTCGG